MIYGRRRKRKNKKGNEVEGKDKMQKKIPARVRDKQQVENIILALILVLLFIFAIYMSGRAYATPDTITSYTVKSGDTLWEIAEMHAPNYHTGNVVNKIERLNHIDGYIVPGQVLTVPVEPMIMEASAYTWTGNKTATGTWPKEGRTVAVDPAVIPLGSELVINGIPGYIAEDTGGAIKGRVVDIYMESETVCYEWGRRPVKIIVLPKKEE